MSVFALPPGADFGARFVEGLVARHGHLPPEEFARLTVWLASDRLRKAVRAAFDDGPARLLPRLRLVQQIGSDLAFRHLPPAAPALRRELELARLVGALLDADPSLAPRAAVPDLARSLAALLDEMHEEGVSPEAIRTLSVPDLSGHWDRARRFVTLAQDYLAATPDRAPDPGERQAAAIDRLVAGWAAAPPAHPVIVAGSTGSRGTTLRLMEAVARLPGGAVLLPGFDFDLPADVWTRLMSGTDGDDHPQARHARLLARLGRSPAEVAPWTGARPPDPARNRLVSLALRPAPVTDRWREEGPALGDLRAATAGLTLIEAPHPRAEAEAVALLLRGAAEAGRSAALVTPDRALARRVATLLGRWGIEPDDSAGPPLGQTPPGRLLRQVARLFGTRPAPDTLLALLKHPLASAGARGPHQRATASLELFLRRASVPHPDRATLRHWAAGGTGSAPPAPDPDRAAWADWLAGWIEALPGPGAAPPGALVAAHVALAERLVAGPAGRADALWGRAAGRRAAELMAALEREAGAAGPMDAAGYEALFRAQAEALPVREAEPAHPQVLIRGPLEARAGGTDLVILGGLNDGTWPALPGPDPWLNRPLRRQAGMRLPERRVGLSAHDWQMAVAAPEAVLTRTLREAEAQPVPSRWLNRLQNLLAGLPGTGGPAALAEMRARGTIWLERAALLDSPREPVPPAPRPSPRPPVAHRPATLSVTQVETLIRDPYAVYARHILRLKRLDPLRPVADAPLRGKIVHAIMARFIPDFAGADDPRALLLALADAALDADAPWPGPRALWRQRIERVADWLVATEAQRPGTPLALETDGALALDGFTLTCRADRIDALPDGRLAILDYKTGTPPTARQIATLDVQLLLEALIAEAGGFPELGPADVAVIEHVGLGASPSCSAHPLDAGGRHDFSTATARARLARLLARYASPEQGYTARRALQSTGSGGDYDQLSRFGEWDETAPPCPEDVG